MTEYHRAGGLNNRNVFSCSSGGYRSERKALAGRFLLRPLLGWQLAGFLPVSSHGLPSAGLCVPIFSSYDTVVLAGATQ